MVKADDVRSMEFLPLLANIEQRKAVIKKMFLKPTEDGDDDDRMEIYEYKYAVECCFYE